MYLPLTRHGISPFQSTLDEFNKTDPYGITVHAENASWLVLQVSRQSARQDVISAYKTDPKWGPVADA
jgi:hypothetical protein